MSIPNETENIPDRLHVTGNDPIYIDNIIILYIYCSNINDIRMNSIIIMVHNGILYLSGK